MLSNGSAIKFLAMGTATGDNDGEEENNDNNGNHYGHRKFCKKVGWINKLCKMDRTQFEKIALIINRILGEK